MERITSNSNTQEVAIWLHLPIQAQPDGLDGPVRAMCSSTAERSLDGCLFLLQKKKDEYNDLVHHPQKRKDKICLHPQAMQRQNVKLKACLRCEEL